MRALYWLTLSLIIPGLLLRLQVGTAGILGIDIILSLFSVLWIVGKFITPSDFPRMKLLLPAGALLVFMIISFLFGTTELFTREKLLSFAFILRFLTSIIFGWATVEYYRETQNKPRFITCFLVFVALTVALGFVQFYVFPDLTKVSTVGGWDPHIGRFLGTWMDPNYLSGFLGFCAPLVIALWYRTGSIKHRTLLGILLVAVLYGLFLSFSRSGYLAAGLGLLLFFLLKNPKVILIATVIVIIGISTSKRSQQRLQALGGTILSIVTQSTHEIDPTANLRIQSWLGSFELFKKNPILGIGYNTYRYKAAEEGIVNENFFSAGGADSTHLTMLVTTGILGFLCYIWFLWTLFWEPMRQWIRRKNTLALGLSSGLACLFVHAFFVNSFFFPLIFVPVMFFWGIVESEKHA